MQRRLVVPCRAFTLVEMMIVVAIMMVLAAIALPAVYKYQITAKESEIRINVDGIQTAETAYSTAFDAVLLQVVTVPGPTPSRKTAVPWVMGTAFDQLGWRPDGDVRAVYAIDQGVAAEPWVARGCIDADADMMCGVCEGTATAFKCGDQATACGVCFAPGTPILMADGTSSPIEDVRVGDEVLAYDNEGQVGVYPVERMIDSGRRSALLLELDDGTRIVATATHPFFTGTPEQDPADDRMAWTRLGDLRPGDVVYRLSGDALSEDRVLLPVTVEHLTPLAESVPVYNLTVGGAHTFFADRVLAHNKITGPCYGQGLWF